MLFEVPLDPAGSTARQWLADELARPEYQVKKDWLGELIVWLFDALGGEGGAGSQIGSWLVLTLVVALAVFIGRWIWRANDNISAKNADGAGSSLIAAEVSAAEYRARAQAAFESGDPDTAVVEGFRALIADLDRRGVLGDQPARTAREAALAVGNVLPAAGAEVTVAAGVFDRALYALTAPPRTSLDEAARVLALADRLHGVGAR